MTANANTPACELPAAGARAALAHDIDRYPHFLAPAGALGTVCEIGDERIFALQLDAPLQGAEEWDNMILWDLSTDECPLRDLRLLEPEPIARDLVGRPVEGAVHPADTRLTVRARAANPWLTVDESLGLPGWVLEALVEATPETIRGRMLNMSDRYLLAAMQRRLDHLEGLV